MNAFFDTGNPFWSRLLRTSAQVSVLVLLVFACQWLWRKKLSPRWRFALWWVVLARLLLPEGLLKSFTRDELRHVFLHELAHVKRHDIAVNWLATLLQILHWFNPLVWLAFSRMRADRELACDALALSCAAPNESKAYGQTIIKLLEGFVRPSRLPGLIGILEDKSQMKRRIAMIARFHETPRWSVWALLLLLALGLVTLTDAQSKKAPATAASKAPSPAAAAKPQSVDTKIPSSQPKSRPREAMAQKLDSILIEELSADNLPLNEVVRYLQDMARARDSEKQGINFILASPAADPVRPSSIDPATGLPVAVEPRDLRSVTVRVLPALRNVTLREALEVVVKTADAPIQYSVETYGVVFSLRGVEPPPPAEAKPQGKDSKTPTTKGPETETLQTRWFKVHPDALRSGVRSMSGANLIPVELANKADGSTNSRLSNLRWFLTNAGVNFDPPKAIFYDDRAGTLMIRATLQDMDIIEQAIQALNTSPPQLQIAVKWCEIEEDAGRALGFDWLLGRGPTNAMASTPARPAGTKATGAPRSNLTTFGLRSATNGSNTETATLTGILTDPQFRVVLHALEKRRGTDILSTPTVTTLSGRQAQIKTVEIRHIVTDLDWSTNGASVDAQGKPSMRGTPIAEPFELGPMLDVVPYVGADGYTITLSVIANLKEFVGYDLSVPREMTEEQARKRFGAGDPQTKAAARPSDPYPLPIFHTRQIVSSAIVWDGQTVVLGGLISESAQKMKDKVPVLGDIPLVGRLFRSETNVTKRKHLLIFVTPTIIDPAGNRVHAPEEMPFSQNAVPPQKTGKL